MYYTCQSEKDKDKLVHKNFVYRKAGKNAWACIDRKCGARAIINPKQPEITTNGVTHNHPENREDEEAKTQRHQNRKIETLLNAIENRYQNLGVRELDYNNTLISIVEWYFYPNNLELDLMVANYLKPPKGQPKINPQALKIMECRYSPEMNELLHAAFCKQCSTNLQFFNPQNPIFKYCLDLLYDYKIMRYQNLIPPNVENIITEADFRVGIDLVLSQIIKRLLRRINQTFLAYFPYKRQCICCQDCRNEPIHSVCNYMIFLGCISPVYEDNPAVKTWFKNKQICRYGRFKDPLLFRRYYYKKQLYMQSNSLLSTSSCPCGNVYANNGVHSLCNWMLDNQLVTNDDFDLFIQTNRPLVCPSGRMTRAVELLTFIYTNTNLFEECKEDQLENDKLYFSYCVRIQPDIQGAIICRTKERVVYGLTMFQGMAQRTHFLYKGNLCIVEKLLTCLEKTALEIDYSVKRVDI